MHCLVPQVRMYSRVMAVIGAFLVLASGAGEVYRQKPRTRSLQSTGQIFLGIYLICLVRFFPQRYPVLFSLNSRENIVCAHQKGSLSVLRERNLEMFVRQTKMRSSVIMNYYYFVTLLIVFH